MPEVKQVIYVVYESPNDYPGQYVIRRWLVGDEVVCDEDPICVHPSYAVAVATLPPGLARIARDEMDDPAILESWL